MNNNELSTSKLTNLLGANLESKNMNTMLNSSATQSTSKNINKSKTEEVDLSFILLVQEDDMHPEPYLSTLINKFESLSILRIYKSGALEDIKTRPMFDDRYLIIFENVAALKNNTLYIKFDYMFPVLVSNKTEIEKAAEICTQKSIKFKIYKHLFEKEDAVALICNLANEREKTITTSFYEELIKTVGLSPKRIVSAMSVLLEMDLTPANIKKYIEKYNYISNLDIILCLLGIPKNKRHLKRVALYLNKNRHWYRKYIKPSLIEDIDSILYLYQCIIDGTLTINNASSFENTDIKQKLILFTIELFNKKTLVEVLYVQKLLHTGDILDVVAGIVK